MPRFIRGDLWLHLPSPDFIVIPASAEIPGRRGLDLSTRAGKRARRYSGLDLRAIAEEAVLKADNPKRYGFLVLPTRGWRFGLFQTRLNADDNVSIDLIRHSIAGLKQFALENPALHIGAPFPGDVRWRDVDPDYLFALAADLPANVHIYIENPRFMPKRKLK